MTPTDWMRRERLARGLPVDVVAGLAGVSRSSVTDWERGATTPLLESWIAWCGALGHDPAEALAAMLAGRPLAPPRTCEWPGCRAHLDPDIRLDARFCDAHSRRRALAERVAAVAS